MRPGAAVTIEVDVANTGSVIDGVTAWIEGVDPALVHLDTPSLSLFPEGTGVLQLTLRVPTTAPAGEHGLPVHVVSSVDPSVRTVHVVHLTVEPFSQAVMRVTPTAVTGGGRATVTVQITNTGNVQGDFLLFASEDTRAVECTVTPSTFTLAAGHTAHCTIALRGPRPWFGQTASRSLLVGADASGIELRERVTFNQKPRIARGLATVAMLAGIIALWATIFLVVVDLLRTQPAPTKLTATDFDRGGAQELPVALVAGSVTGKVTSAANGAGLPRAAVAAYRVKPDGSTEASASAATADDGTYSLAGVLPGVYVLKVSAEGYPDTWYPTATDVAGAERLRVAPLATVADRDVVLAGKPASIVGAVETPQSEGATPTMSVTVQRVLDTAAAATGAGGTPPAPVVVQTTGDVNVPDLVAPATYRVTVESPGFEAQQVTLDVAAGETKVLNTVRLGAATGSIRGTVVDGAGAPLGNVSVVVRSGDLEVKTTTPTAGEVGSFVVPKLPTPATYVLTFTLPGFSSVTEALDLAAGEARTGVVARLIGGTGTVQGRVSGPTGAPLGGVTVTVARGAFSASASTLTTGDVGGYTIANIPVPGAYTVTFSSPGLVSETRVVTFTVAGPITGVDATLRSSLASLSGTVTSNGAPIGGATVTLTDGRAPRSTATATRPAGAYAFADLAPGTYTVTVTAPNRPTRIVIVAVAEGQASTRDIELGG